MFAVVNNQRPRMIRALFIVGVALQLSACASLDFLHNRFNPPQKEAPLKVAGQWQAPLPHDGKLANLSHFWAQFHDPVLDQLLAQAEQDNPSLDLALANIKAARANVTIEGAANYPALSGSASVTEANSSFGNTSTFKTRTSNVELDASWEIDLFGRIHYAKKAAQATLAGRESDWHLARVTLAAEVANQYLDYRSCQLLVNTYREQQVSKDVTARLTKIQAEAGFAAPADAALAEASASSTRSSLIAQQAQCDATVKALVALTGFDEPVLTSILGEGGAAIPQPSELIVNRVPAEVISQRPDLVASASDLAAASAKINVAEANRYPSLTLSGFIGIADTTIDGNSAVSKPWSFGPSLTLPIFNAGKLKSQVLVAQANYEAALANYHQQVRDAVKEVEQALVNLNSATQREQAEMVSANQYQVYFKAAEINWKAGGLSLINLEDARRQLINAQLSLINQQHDRVQYWIALYKALGGGWQPLDESTQDGEGQ